MAILGATIEPWTSHSVAWLFFNGDIYHNECYHHGTIQANLFLPRLRVSAIKGSELPRDRQGASRGPPHVCTSIQHGS